MEQAEYALMDHAEARMWWYRALHARLIDALEGAEGPILDAGCGTGGLLARLVAAVPLPSGTAPPSPSGPGHVPGLVPGISRRPTTPVPRPVKAWMAGPSPAMTKAATPATANGGQPPQLFGLEFNPEAATRAKAKSQALIARGSVNALPFAADTFGAVIMADVLCHAAVDPDAALAEARRVLRPNGRLIVNMPAYQWLASAHDRRVQNARRLTARQTAALLMRNGFPNATTRYWNGLLLPLMIVQRKILARGESMSDVAAFPPRLDAILHSVTEIERRRALPLPFGGSVLAVAEKP